MTGIEAIEKKLLSGVKTFTPEEVAHLLNEIKIYKHLYQIETGRK